MSESNTRVDRTYIRKGKLKEAGNDYWYWQTKSHAERLDALEDIRNEYNTWKYGAEQGFQRVYRIIKREKR